MRPDLPAGTVTLRSRGGARGRGEIARFAGDLDRAVALSHFDEGAFNHACVLEILGESARRAGDQGRARARFAAGLRSFGAIGDGGGMADCLDGLARIAATTEDPTRGVVYRAQPSGCARHAGDGPRATT